MASAKALANLVSSSRGGLGDVVGRGVSDESVLEEELERYLPDLVREHKAGEHAKLPPPPPTTKTSANPATKLSAFLEEVSTTLGFPNEDVTAPFAKARSVLTSYLAVDFRGTRDSLKRLLSDEAARQLLLADLWQFHRSERLYLLQAMKQVVCCNVFDDGSATYSIYKRIYDKAKARGLKSSLINRLEDGLLHKIASDGNSSHGSAASSPRQESLMVHYHLRELSEILQILIVYVHVEDEEGDGAVTPAEFLQLSRACQVHGFGSRPLVENKEVAADDKELLESVGQLESLLLISIIGKLSRQKWSAGSQRQTLNEADKVIWSFGNVRAHGPVMLAWMLANYPTWRQSPDEPKYKVMGEKAVLELDVLGFLAAALEGSDALAPTVASVAHCAVYSLVSLLLESFDHERFDDGALHRLVCLLLRTPPAATDFWSEAGREDDEESGGGLGAVVDRALSRFPADLDCGLALLAALARAGPSSANQVLATLRTLGVYAEPVEEVGSHEVENLAAHSMVFRAVTARRPRKGGQVVVIPGGTAAATDGRHFLWRVQYDGLALLLREVEDAVSKVSTGVRNLSPEKLRTTVLIANLLEGLLLNVTSTAGLVADLSGACFALVGRFSQVQNPPIELLASCVRSLSFVARERPQPVWERLSEMGIFPFIVKSHLRETNSIANSVVDVNPGLVGALLAQQECVRGVYPLTNAFLDLLLACASPAMSDGNNDNQQQTGGHWHPTAPSVLYVINDLFPSFQNWAFSTPGDRERLGQKILRVCLLILENSDYNRDGGADDGDDDGGGGGRRIRRHQDLVLEALSAPAPNSVLLAIASTGDRTIQALWEAQSSVDSGVGLELSELVNLSLRVLDAILLLRHRQNGEGPWGDEEGIKSRIVCPRFLLTVAHYVYHQQSCQVPVSAIRLLATVARMFPRSMLACFGNDAEAIRDILLHRLESKTEDINLKLAIVKFFTACIEGQPGLMLVLMDLKEEDKAQAGSKSSAEVKGTSGCLKSVVWILSDIEKVGASSPLTTVHELHMVIVDFVYNLWSHQLTLAVAHLKRQDQFWRRLTRPLFDDRYSSEARLNGCILRIVTSEIYTYCGKVDQDLVDILEQLFDHGKHLRVWCSRVVDQLSPSSAGEARDAMFLLGSWKTFLMVLSRDEPISIAPHQCGLVASCLLRAVRRRLASGADDDVRVTTSLSETLMVLTQRWQARCVASDSSGGGGGDNDDMERWCGEQMVAGLLADAVGSFRSLHPRCRAAVLTVASTTLRFSSPSSKPDAAKNLLSWLDPAADLVQRSLAAVSSSGGDDRGGDSVVAVLAVDLLNLLLGRLGAEPALWMPCLHRRALVQVITCGAHHAISAAKSSAASSSSRHHRQLVDLVEASLGLLLTVARSGGESGTWSVLANDPVELLWLPLSSVAWVPVGEDAKAASRTCWTWAPVFRAALYLATALLQVGGQHSLDGAISFAALLQDQIVAFLLTPWDSVREEHLRLALTAASFVSVLMPHFNQWQLQHPQSLHQMSRAIGSLLHVSVCFLIRSSVLRMLISQYHRHTGGGGADDLGGGFGSGGSPSGGATVPTTPYHHHHKVPRARRSSSREDHQEGSAWATDVAAEEEFAVVQDLLLRISASCLESLSALSPDLVALVTGDVRDMEASNLLLQADFATPNFEVLQQALHQHQQIRQQRQGPPPHLLVAATFGTVIAFSNLCIRHLTMATATTSARQHLSSSSYDRSPPSPLPSSLAEGSPPGPPHSPSQDRIAASPDRRPMLLMLLERSMVLLMSQSLACLASDRLQVRDKQLLRRELGAELLGSICESVRRYLHRASSSSASLTGGTSGRTRSRSPHGSSPEQLGGAGPASSHSPGQGHYSAAAQQQSKVLPKLDEEFMKLMTNIAQNVFK